MRLRASVFRLALATLCLVAPAALACPTCACGNPAMTSMGAEQPFVNRVRLATTVRAWQQDEGTVGVDAMRLRELRVDVSASWSPTRWLTFAANVPVQLREQQAVNLERQTGFGWGEVELTARAVVLGSEVMRPKALVSVLAGARLPTALTLADARRVRLDTDAQLGPGALVPLLGVAWSGFFGDRWSALVSLVGEVPFEGRYGLRMGPAAVLVGLGQLQPLRWLGVRAGVDVRGELPSWSAGAADARLAGVLGSLLADVVLSPASSVVVLAGVRAAVVDSRSGPVRTWPIPLVSVVVDL